jgi:KaiC/GvpD/RAD55 family RecA-like ATPase
MNNPYRHPISKLVYENLIESEAIIKKFDRSFRKVLKFESRKYVDPANHARREARMLERSKKRWDGSYTLFTGNLTEEEQKYKDYFETDQEKNKEDERLEEFLDKQELLTDERYSLRHFDFQ